MILSEQNWADENKKIKHFTKSCELICRVQGQDYRWKNKCSDPYGKDELTESPEVQRRSPFSGAMESHATFYSTTQDRQSIQHVRWQQREIGLHGLLGWSGRHFRSVIPVPLRLKEPRQGTITNFTDWCKLTTNQNSRQGLQFYRRWKNHHPSSSYSEISSMNSSDIKCFVTK